MKWKGHRTKTELENSPPPSSEYDRLAFLVSDASSGLLDWRIWESGATDTADGFLAIASSDSTAGRYKAPAGAVRIADEDPADVQAAGYLHFNSLSAIWFASTGTGWIQQTSAGG